MGAEGLTAPRVSTGALAGVCSMSPAAMAAGGCHILGQ
jgi:hypothetical protein